MRAAARSFQAITSCVADVTVAAACAAGVSGRGCSAAPHAWAGGRARGHAGQVVEVVALSVRQAQGAGQPGQHLARGVRAAGLLQPRVVLGRDERELRCLLAPQPGGTAPRPGGAAPRRRG